MDFADAGAAERALNEMNGHKFFDHVSRIMMMMMMKKSAFVNKMCVCMCMKTTIGDQAQLGTAIQAGYW